MRNMQSIEDMFFGNILDISNALFYIMTRVKNIKLILFC